MFGELLVRKKLNEIINEEYEEIKFSYNKYGKPKIDHLGYHFNISHSGEYVFCGIDEAEIGIDIEKMKEIDMGISKYVFTKDELKFLGKDSSKLNDTFYRLWVMKESIIKAKGEGFSTDVLKITMNVSDEITRYLNLFVKEYAMNDYKLAVCSHVNEFPSNIDIINWEEIMEYFLFKT